MTEILAVEARGNAQMIADMAALGLLREDAHTLDPTYGLGRFYTLWRPTMLTATDLLPERSLSAGRSVDYTNLPYAARTFRQVIFDPPYKLNGTSTGEGPAASDADYGVAGEYLSPKAKYANIMAGMAECVRVLEIGGTFVLKCQNQVCNGKVYFQVFDFYEHARSLNCTLVATFMNTGWRAQPGEQKTVRNNYSTALVFRKNAPPEDAA